MHFLDIDFGEYPSIALDPPLVATSYLGQRAPQAELHNFPDCPMGQVDIAWQPGWDSSSGKTSFNHHVVFAGRRNRVLASYCRYLYRSPAHHAHWFTSSVAVEPRSKPVFVRDYRMTFREAFEELQGDSEQAESAREWLSHQKLRRHKENQMYETAGQITGERSAQLHSALHDVALVIRRDLTQAIEAANWGGYYPGVDEGIDPVPDTLVEAVIVGTQRELDKELRGNGHGQKLPAYPLATLPFAIQRAFAERRRLRFKSWGIGREEWEKNDWSVWNVPDDDWLPDWLTEITEE